MEGRAITIKVNGEMESHDLTKVPTLEQLKEWIGGGYLEHVPMWDRYEGEYCVVFCDEDGKQKGQRINDKATTLWYEFNKSVLPDYLVGQIVIIVGDKALIRGM